MKKFSIKIKIPFNKILNYSYVVVGILSIFAFSYVSYFLYINFYKTITQSEEIIILRQEVAIEDINMKKFDLIMEKIKEKSERREVNINLRF